MLFRSWFSNLFLLIRVTYLDLSMLFMLLLLKNYLFHRRVVPTDADRRERFLGQHLFTKG